MSKDDKTSLPIDVFVKPDSVENGLSYEMIRKVQALLNEVPMDAPDRIKNMANDQRRFAVIKALAEVIKEDGHAMPTQVHSDSDHNGAPGVSSLTPFMMADGTGIAIHMHIVALDKEANDAIIDEVNSVVGDLLGSDVDAVVKAGTLRVANLVEKGLSIEEAASLVAKDQYGRSKRAQDERKQ